MTVTNGGDMLRVDGLSVAFNTDIGVSAAVNDVSFSLASGRVLAILGESGSGKSVLLRTILGISRGRRTKITGQIHFQGRDLVGLKEKDYLRVRAREIAMIFQDATTALDPVFTVGHQLTETMTRNLGISRVEARRRAVELLDRVKIVDPQSRLSAYPDQLSGGMRQRVMIALAMSCEPRLLLADEPTTALDVTVQAQILRLILELQKQTQSAMIFVTHDIGVASNVADDVAVMYGGRIVEQGPIADVLRSPEHPYTRGLIDANVTPGQRARLRTIPGQPPRADRLPPGCSFSDRCPHARDVCRTAVPPLYPLGDAGRSARCVLVADGARAPVRAVDAR